MNSLTSMTSQDIVDTNYFLGFDSTSQSILETTNASDLTCDGSDVSFHITFPTDAPSLSGMATNTTQEISVLNMEIPNLDKEDSTSATFSTTFRIPGQQEKLDDLSSVDGLMISDFLFDLDNYEVRNFMIYRENCMHILSIYFWFLSLYVMPWRILCK